MHSLIVTATLNDVGPRAWRACMLRRIAGHFALRLHELLPWTWHQPAQSTEAAALAGWVRLVEDSSNKALFSAIKIWDIANKAALNRFDSPLCSQRIAESVQLYANDPAPINIRN